MEDVAVYILVAAIVAAALYAVASRRRQAVYARRKEFVHRYTVPAGVLRNFHARRPGLNGGQTEMVAHALRDYFLISLAARKSLVSMPSRAVDELWHEFILSTRAYHDFCRRAFGYYLHHIPAAAMGPRDRPAAGIRRCWRLACALDHIDPKKPHRLPLLFNVDIVLDIPEGYRYVLDCDRQPKSGNPTYCASHIGCDSGGGGDAGDIGHGTSGDWSDAGTTGGDGGGCGGGGD